MAQHHKVLGHLQAQWWLGLGPIYNMRPAHEELINGCMLHILAASPMSLLHWRHNGRDCFSNNQPYDCLLNHLFKRRSKNASKVRVTGLCEGNSPGTGEFPAQMASNADDVSIWWRHHASASLVTTNIIVNIYMHIYMNSQMLCPYLCIQLLHL